jgi:hypothetical protein
MNCSRTLVLLATLVAPGCEHIHPVPIIDLQGVDQVKYNRDLADCYKEQGVFVTDQMLPKCVERKGYKVIGLSGT